MEKIFFIIATISLIAADCVAQDITVDSAATEEYQGVSDSIYIEPATEVCDVTVEDGEEEQDFIVVEFPEYEAWESVSLQGKLKMQGLPMSPTLKIYMRRDSMINISIRAPFVGEAGRIILTQDTILAINKMNKTYVKEKIPSFIPDGNLNPVAKVLLNNIQDLLLARFFLPGIDLAEEDPEELMDVFEEESQFNVVPKGKAEITGLKYGYIVDDGFNPLMILFLPENRPDLEIDVAYKYELKGYDVQFVIRSGEIAKEILLEFKDPEWGADEPKPIEVEKKFRKVNFEEFIRGIG